MVKSNNRRSQTADVFKTLGEALNDMELPDDLQKTPFSLLLGCSHEFTEMENDEMDKDLKEIRDAIIATERFINRDEMATIIENDANLNHTALAFVVCYLDAAQAVVEKMISDQAQKNRGTPTS